LQEQNHFVELKKGEFHIIEQLLLNSGLLGEEFTKGNSNPIPKLKYNFNRNKLKVFVYYHKGIVVSFCVTLVKINLYNNTAYDWHIAYFYTNESYRRKGIGYNMLTYIFDFLTKTKAGIISLYTTDNNLPAISLYTKFGFKETKYIGNYNCYSLYLNDYSNSKRKKF